MPPHSAARIAIDDQTQQGEVLLRRSIYLTIMSSLDFEECAHKLCKIKLQPGQEVRAIVLSHMVISGSVCILTESIFDTFRALCRQSCAK